MKVLLIGSSGATAEYLLDCLLADSRVTEVVVFVRKPLSFTHSKLKVFKIHFDELHLYENQCAADVAISCLGTMLQQAGSKDNQWKVDYEYQLQFAKNCTKQGVPHFILLSAIAASSTSRFFYNRMKRKS